MHAMQNLIVAVLVPGCSAYAAWKLIPSAARRMLASSMLRVPHLPAAIETRLRRAAQATSGCGCDGCDHAEKKPATTTAAVQTITFHPRTRR